MGEKFEGKQGWDEPPGEIPPRESAAEALDPNIDAKLQQNDFLNRLEMLRRLQEGQ